jgi:hypothetical protein
MFLSFFFANEMEKKNNFSSNATKGEKIKDLNKLTQHEFEAAVLKDLLIV